MDEYKTEKCSQVPSNEGSNLDTLGQLRHPPYGGLSEDNIKTLKKRRIAKAKTLSYLFPLIDLNSDNLKGYWATYRCCHVIQQGAGKITAEFCDRRWCVVCNRIRMAKCIKGYGLIIQSWPDAHFVTLTAPTIPYDQLADEIERRASTWRKLRTRKNMRSIQGIRSVEVKPAKGRSDHVHPHYHLIVDTKQGAEAIKSAWLDLIGNAESDAQDVKKADQNSIIELFKYITKLDASQDPAKLDTIFSVLKGRRLIQPFGGVKKIKEEVDDQEAVVFTEDVQDRVWLWINSIKTWVCPETDEVLVNTDETTASQ